MPENSFRYFRNFQCRYFPCHEGIDPENFNCLFCYCPLDHIINCGGDYTITKDGKKDCGKCVLPHIPENYGEVVAKVKKLLDEKKFPDDGFEI